MVEEWRDIKGYEGLYQISSLGNILCLRDGILVSQWRNDVCGGYCYARLYDGKGKFKNVRVHRLVAIAFIPNPNNLPEVNHKDENKENNRRDNLEWITHKDNIHYGTCRERISKSLKGRTLSDEVKQRIRENSAKPFLGRHHTDETKQLLSKMQSGSNNNRATKLKVYNNSLCYEFSTIKEGCIKMNVNQKSVYNHLDNHTLYKGYYWERSK